MGNAKIFFHKKEIFLQSDKYFEFVKKFADCLKNNKDLEILLDEDEIYQIEIPTFLREIAVETGQPLNNVLNFAIRSLNIEWKYGNFYKNKNIIRLIRLFPDMEESMKLKLIGYILQHINEGLCL